VRPGGTAVTAPTSLPVLFDTIGIWRTILKGAILFEAVVVVPGIGYSLFISRDGAAAAGLGLVGAILGFFTARAFPLMEGGTGSIAADGVTVRRGRVLGVRLPGAEGRFPLDRFRGIRVEEASAPMASTTGRQHERVYLVGKEGTPDILIARTEDRMGARFAEELGRLTGLASERESVPY